MSITPGMEYDPKRDWVDVADPDNPPPGASKITKADLMRYEDGLEDAETAINGLITVISDEISTQVSELTEGIAESALWPDTANPGLYFFRQGGQLIPSSVPGLYDINPDQPPMPNFEIPTGVMIQAMESTNGTYVRPSDDVNVRCTFVGVNDPISVAFNGDRWDKVPAVIANGISQYIKINGAWV